MTKLNQVIAARTHKTPILTKALIHVANKLQKQDLFLGISRRYVPFNDDGRQLPDEVKNVQVTVPEVLAEASEIMSDLIDLELTNAVGNNSAYADVVVDGQVLLNDVPVTGLMALEKLLKEKRQLLERIPTNVTSSSWTYSEDTNLWSTPEQGTVRTAKVPRVIVKYEATEFGPAQTEMVTIDEPEGTWWSSSSSGCVSPSSKAAMLKRCDNLLVAVKAAKEQANMIDVTPVDAGARLMKWIIGDAR